MYRDGSQDSDTYFDEEDDEKERFAKWLFDACRDDGDVDQGEVEELMEGMPEEERRHVVNYRDKVSKSE